MSLAMCNVEHREIVYDDWEDGHAKDCPMCALVGRNGILREACKDTVALLEGKEYNKNPSLLALTIEVSDVLEKTDEEN